MWKVLMGMNFWVSLVRELVTRRQASSMARCLSSRSHSYKLNYYLNFLYFAFSPVVQRRGRCTRKRAAVEQIRGLDDYMTAVGRRGEHLYILNPVWVGDEDEMQGIT